MRVFLSLATIILVHASATAATLDFTGTGVSSCTLTGATPGTILQQPDLKSWKTGTPASIIATNTLPSTLAITPPNNWTDFPANTPSTTFTVQAAVIGTNVINEVTGSALGNISLTLLGVNTVSVWLSASAASVYPGGDYKAQVTVTCVPR